jgi:hypothetical protein
VGGHTPAFPAAKLLDSRGVELLHDRRICGSRANIDHLAIGPGGVTVIDAKNYRGKVRTERRARFERFTRAAA